MDNSSTALAVVGYDRPYYFSPTLRSLLCNSVVQQCDLWIFIDGGQDSLQQWQVRIAQQELSRADYAPRRIEFVLRPTNYGCGRNLIDAKRKLFDDLNYDQVFVFEDDMLVSPDYLQLSLNLLAWSQLNFRDIGVVQAYHACWLPPDQKVARLDEVTAANSHWWGYLMPRQTWEAMREVLYVYEDTFLRGRKYSQRNISLIRTWVRGLMENLDQSIAHYPPSAAGAFPGHWNFREYFQRDTSCGQDAATALALAVVGLKKVVTTVNRGLPIGCQGIHFTPKSFYRRRFHEMELDVFESDPFLTCFRPCNADQTVLAPYMRADEVEALRRLLREQKPRRVLEFGAGGSTIVLSREPAVQEWWSLEHSEIWQRQVLASMSNGEAQRIKLLACSEEDLPARLEGLLNDVDFDLFFVDGYDRPLVLQLLSRHLQHKKGLIVLHDYARPAYAPALELFAQRREISTPGAAAQGLLVLSMERS